ncbi:integral membrane transferase [Streptantibioticus cattleyicolor NRRL 8057 = DSM 46488]|uniref:Integral membrane transferase n=1 Tax=Streptantibioticus cattleyicolor (strain ATCC 35852 / DSM 46488 / JCM 4925 / NBRC 14057 / NRRL 8057) TaxID=1003195 RepID=F8JZJ8_STREN|nr:integral membrane transferase [Streptantibioticus cattleyicolor NRRL 8057 = DSM 46488]MYS61750.1 CDP-alcohol phosphatidyltransferase family protein [Streptomyces sp. SID5468]CCB77620.1 Integral membrane transferase [Streptantibioticus cattleyicolor NRRL 8057 = DSM 46488]
MVRADGPGELADRLAAVPAGARVAVVDPRFVGHRHALRLALTDPRFPAGAVPGALGVAPEGRPALQRAVTSLTRPAPVPATSVPAGSGAPAPAAADATVPAQTRTSRPRPTDLPGVLAERLADAGVAVHQVDLGVLTATVPADEAARTAAAEAVAAVDDERVRLRSAVKSRDGFFTTFCISPYSRYLARWCARRGLTPNQVTTASLLVALVAAGCAATGTRPGFVAAGVLLIASFVLDCTDGQLARYSLRYSTLGAWLDATFDRVKEYAYYAGLAIGAAHMAGHHDDVWALALGAMVLQTCRHVVDFAFTEANHDATANTSPTAALSDRLDSVGWTVWARRMIVLPIGERWAMIAVLTAVTTPRVVFLVLLIGCALAACYTTAGRVLRSLTRRARRTDRAAVALADLADSGALARLLARPVRGLPPFGAPACALLGSAVAVATAWLAPAGSWWPVLGAACYVVISGIAVAAPLKGALDWLVPPFFRAAEYTVILALAARSGVPGALPAAFGLVAAVAYHHYDTVYRIRGGTGAPPRALIRAIGGHEGRLPAVTVLAALLAHTHALTTALAALAGILALVVLTESIRFWISAGAPAVHDETGEPT